MIYICKYYILIAFCDYFDEKTETPYNDVSTM